MWRSKQPVAEKGSHANEQDNITITRSDGINHDLLTVFSAKSNNNESLQNIVTDSEVSTGLDKIHEDIDNITISRSDGRHHDIIKVFKANNEQNEEEAKSMPKRSLSMGKIELPKFLSFGKLQPRPSMTAAKPSDTTYYPKTVRIVHMSDTGNFLENKPNKSAFLPTGDILVHTGDFTVNGTDEEFDVFNQWLGAVSGRYHYRIVCLGNHDVRVYGNDWKALKSKLSNATHVLCHEEAIVLGIRFYGSPWHWGHKNNYTIRSGAPSSTSGRFDEIPAETQVLLTHGPAYDRLDVVTAAETKEHWGSRELAENLRRVRPGLHLHGHTKDSRGLLLPFGNSPLSVNSCMTDKNDGVLYACPHVIKATSISDNALSSAPPTWVFQIDTLDC